MGEIFSKEVLERSDGGEREGLASLSKKVSINLQKKQINSSPRDKPEEFPPPSSSEGGKGRQLINSLKCKIINRVLRQLVLCSLILRSAPTLPANVA